MKDTNAKRHTRPQENTYGTEKEEKKLGGKKTGTTKRGGGGTGVNNS